MCPSSGEIQLKAHEARWEVTVFILFILVTTYSKVVCRQENLSCIGFGFGQVWVDLVEFIVLKRKCTDNILCALESFMKVSQCTYTVEKHTHTFSWCQYLLVIKKYICEDKV